MKLNNIKNLYTKAQEEVEQVHDEQKILTLKMDRHIAKYIGISNPNFIAIIRCSIDLYKWIQRKNSCKELLTVKEKILIEEKQEDGKISNNVDDSSLKKKMDNRIRVTEMTLNESELEVLSGENLKEAENKAVLLYAECGCLDKSKEPVLEETLVPKANLNIKDKDKMVVDSAALIILKKLQLQNEEILTKQEQFSLLEGNQVLNNLEGEEMNNNIGKKELDHLWDIIQNTIIKAANQTLPKKKILNTGCSKKRSKVKTELEKSILVLGKIIRGIHDGKVSQLNSNIVVSANNNISYINKKLDLEIGLLQLQSLDEGEQDLHGLKKILEKKCLIENTISRNKKIQEKVKKHCEMIVNNQGQMLWAEIYKPASYVQESLYKNLLEEILEKEWKQMLSSL
ncbi:40824_t:CDS:2, partial [Gigaspora margarita]